MPFCRPKLNMFLKKRALYAVLCMMLVFCLLLSGCGGGGALSSGGAEDDGRPARDATPRVLVPEAPGTDLIGNDEVSIDISNKNDGYFVVQYNGSNPDVKVLVDYGDINYQYNLRDGEIGIFNFPLGSGSYKIGVWENVGADQYAMLFEDTVNVEIEDEFKPFLYPNQYVWFTPSSQAVAKGSEAAAGAKDDLGAIQGIYEYVVDKIKYDTNKAESVLAGYVPDVDSTLAEGKGICFDYASLMAAMLRSQGLPTKLVIGYASTSDGSTVLHAWISVYTKEQGWIENIIEFHGDEWVRMDPTFASTSGEAERFTGDGSTYNELSFY